jgi:hypothetical protein
VGVVDAHGVLPGICDHEHAGLLGHKRLAVNLDAECCNSRASNFSQDGHGV